LIELVLHGAVEPETLFLLLSLKCAVKINRFVFLRQPLDTDGDEGSLKRGDAKYFLSDG
jgi:hypothetical protein